LYSVYKHTTPNGKVYIGITKQKPVKRWLHGKGYARQDHFYNAILKYGWDNIKHEILFTELTREEAEAKEVELIAEYKSDQRAFGYNVDRGGRANRMSDETRERLRKANTGKHHSKETCKKLKKLEIARWKDPDYRRNQVEKRLGKSPWNKGVPTAPETKQKQREAKLGKYVGSKHWNSKKVINLDTGKIYESIGLAAKELGKKNGSKIVSACKGERQSAHGYRWAYYEEKEVMPNVS
jgi:group I intron endonuclease